MKKACLPLLPLFLHSIFLLAQQPPVCPLPAPKGANNCTDACIRCSLNGYQGYTTIYTPGQAPGFCGAVENDQWLAFLAGGDSIAVEVAPDSCQDGNGIELALYADCAGMPLACAAGQTGGGATVRTVTAALVPGQVYFLMIDGFQGDHCRFTVNTSPAGAVAPPAATLSGPLQGPTLVAAYSTIAYSVGGSPFATAYTWSGPPGCAINGQPLPVTLAGPAGAQANITFGNQSGTLCVTALSPCGNSPAACLPFSIGGPLFPPCPSNTEPAADLCPDACIFCNFTGYSGTTAGYTPDPAPGFCGAIENNQWVGFIAGQSAITLTAQAENCSLGHGLQLALYQNCAEPPIACNAGQLNGAGLPISLTATLVPNQQYFLMIDGMLGDQCFFTVSVQPPMAGVQPLMGATGPIQGPKKICPGGQVGYSVDPVAGASGYTWTAPPGWLINGHTPPYTGIGAGANAVIMTNGNGSGVISVTPVNNCNTGAKASASITVQPIPVTNLPSIEVCAEDAPFFLPWGQAVTASGKFCTTYSSYLGCDSVVCQQVIFLNPIVFIYPPRVLCEGESFTVCGVPYSAPGNYLQVCESYKGCDSSVYFTLLYLDPSAQILPPGNLNCVTFPVTLNSAAVANGTKTWKNLAGQVLGTGDALTVDQPGAYILMVSVTYNGKTCMASDTIVVPAAADPPVATALGGALNCSQDSIQLMGSSNVSGALYNWTGPGGFSAGIPNPTVHMQGQYVLTVTDPQSGCTGQAIAEVTAMHQAPFISVTGGQLNCYTPTGQITCSTLTPGAVFSWTGPNGFIASEQSPVVSDTGTYAVLVTDPVNGCTAAGFATVKGDFEAPAISATGDVLTCAHPAGMLTCSTTSNGASYFWQGPTGFTSNQQNPMVVLDGKYGVTVTGPNGCTASASVTVLLDIQLPDISIAAADTINCTNPFVTLMCSTTATAPTFAWAGPNGFMSNQQNPSLNQAGAYTVTVTDGQNGCTNTAGTSVVAMDLPQITMIIPEVLNCSKPFTMLGATTTALQPQYVWTGPSGFSWPFPSPLVQTPGQYTLVLTDLATNCTAVGFITVEQNITPPGAQVTGGTLTCALTTLPLAGSSPTPGATFQWTGPGIVGGNTGDTILVDQPGDYLLRVTGPGNGCTSTAVATVVQDILPPAIDLYPGTLNCTVDSLFYELLASPNISFLWTLPDGSTATDPGVWVTMPGSLSLLATNLSNGCTQSLIATLGADTAAPVVELVQVVDDQDGQGVGSIEIAVPNLSNYQVVWTHDMQTAGTGTMLGGLFAGVYTAIVTGPNGCTASLEATVQNTVPAKEAAALAADWRIFPNPTAGLLKVQYLGRAVLPDADFSVLDITGRRVYAQTGRPDAAGVLLRLEGLAPGAYVLLIRTPGLALRRALVLQR